MSAIKVELELVDGSFTTRMMHAGETLAQFNRNVARSNPALRQMAAAGQSVITSMSEAREKSQGFLGTMRDISIVAGVVGVGISRLTNIQDTWIGKLVQTNAEMERLVYQMRGMSTASDPIKDAANNVDYLLQTAQKAPFSLDALSKGFTKLKATGTDPMNGSLQSIVDGIAAFGGTDSSLERAILGISQASGKGVIQMEELRQQLSESMPRAMELMASSMGISIAELVDAVGTGRLQAETALNGFYAQLERTFGGTAQQMMQTFSGQVARSQTVWTQFAQTVGGIDAKTGVAAEGGFMHGLTEALRDFNDAMDSAAGRDFGRTIGSMLSSVLTVGRQAIETIIEFRDAIVSAAMVAGTVVGYRVMMAGIRGLGEAIDATRQRLLLMPPAFTRVDVAQQGLARGTNYVSVALTRQMGVFRATLTSMGALIARNLGPIGLLAIVIIEVANAFDIFDQKGKDAIETLKDFGELSKEQLSDAKDYAKGLQDELNKTYGRAFHDTRRSMGLANGFKWDKLDAEQQVEFNRRLTENLIEIDADYYKKKQELRDINLKLVEAEAKLIDESAERTSAREIAALEKTVATRRRLYDDELREVNKTHDARIAAGEKAEDVRQSRMKETNRLNRELLAGEIKDYENAIDRIRGPKDMEGPLTSANLKTLKTLSETVKNLRAEYDAYEDVKGPTFLPETEDGAKQLEDNAKALKDLNKEIDEAKRQLQGTNPELAEFEAKLAAGDYGDSASEQVQRFAQSMRDAINEKNALDEVLDGRKNIMSDLDAADRKAREEEMRLLEEKMGGALSETEKVLLRYENGFYKGIGPNSPANLAITNTNEGLSLQGRIAEQLGDVLSQNTFGQRTVAAINTVADRLRDMLTSMQSISTIASGVNFSGWNVPAFNNGLPFTGANTPGGFTQPLLAPGEKMGQTRTGLPLSQVATTNGLKAQVNAAYAQHFQGFLKDLEATGYQIRDIGGYNYRNINGTNKLSEHAFGDAIDINHKENPDTGRGGALITDMDPATVRALAAKWGLEWGGDWQSKKDAMHFQVGDALKAKLASGEVPTTAAAPSGFTSAVPTMDPILTAQAEAWKQNQADFDAKVKSLAAEIAGRETKNEATAKTQDLDKQIATMEQGIKSATESVDGLDKHYRGMQKYIADNKLMESNPEQAEKLLAVAKQRDAVEQQMADRKKASSAIESADLDLKQQELELERQLAEARAKLKNPAFEGEARELTNLTEKLDEYVANVGTKYGTDSAAYGAAIQRKEQMLAAFHQKEMVSEQVASKQRTAEMQRGLMTQQQARQSAMQQELAAVDAKLAKLRASGQADVAAVQQFEQEKAAIRAKYASQDPMSAKMREWGDLQTNLAQGAAQWSDQLADGLAGVLMGTGDIKQVLQGIAQQALSMGLKYMFSSMKGNGGATQPAGGKKTPGSVPAGVGKKVGAAHTGAMLGSGVSMVRAVNPAVFKGAKRFHSGANTIGGRKLLPGEVPIIAKKNEGIFTPEQMKAIGESRGGGQQINISAPVTVNANGGTPEQNADLAKQMAKEMEGTMRSVVADEIRVQQRPGNMLNSNTRR